ncbi:MAG TPA: hypothetical protein VJX67_25075 [Blastocatellia bacterium]|nr:hypothetical protein [Blastocatellia bacterium]
MHCPGFEQIIDFVDGALPKSSSAALSEHFRSGCQSCIATRRWYERVCALATSDDTIEPPSWILKRALRLFDERRKPGLATRIGELAASLIFDSQAKPSLGGVRSTEGECRQLLYRAGDYNIDVQIGETSPSTVEILGQVLREGDTGFQSVAALPLELFVAGQPIHAVKTNQLGEFNLRDVSQGEYELRITAREGSIIVSGLPVTIAR